MRTSTVVPVLLALLPACGVTASGDFHDHVGDQGGGESSSTAGGESDGGGTGPISTVTTSPPAESEGDASTAGDTDGTDGTDGSTTESVTTGDDPPGPPRIVGDPQITPNPIKVGGLMAVLVETEDADAVRMTLESGDEIPLAPGDTPGSFVGELEAFTGVDNGWHDVVFTPSRQEQDGDFVVAPYEIALPKPGTEGFWETGDLIGPGQVAGMGLLPGGQIVELGSYTPGGEHRCYLRRRDPNGAWAPSDLVELLPGIECEAVDLKVASDGAIFALVRRQTNTGVLWWLGELPAWGAEVKSRGLGAKGEEVHALAERDGTVAVCGTAPTQQIDEVDVLIQVFQPNLPGQRTVLEYRPMPDDHMFSEISRDCILTTEESLVVVGEAFGPHIKDEPHRSRRFTLTLDLSGDLKPEWIVPDAGLVTQSFATAVDLDDDGHILSVGYICDDDCKPEGWIWLEKPGGALEWQLSLGLFSIEGLAPHDVRWSPAGHAIIASGGLKGDETAFLVRAYKPNESLVWTYKRKDINVLHLALTLAVGPFGEVWVGGSGANGYPAVANIHR